MAKWTIPEPLPFDWEMRDLSSARITVRTLDDGRLEQTIEHAPLPGVRPEMMLWMLEHMGREIEWRGQCCLLYRCWHPIDHIHFAVLGPFGPGCRFHIVEAFQARPEYLAGRVYDVPKLDRTGFRLELRRFGALLASADEDWEDWPEGMGWRVPPHQSGGGSTPWCDAEAEPCSRPGCCTMSRRTGTFPMCSHSSTASTSRDAPPQNRG